MELPTMLCNAGLWDMADEVIIRKHRAVVDEGVREWVVCLQARERVGPWREEKVSATGPNWKRIILKPYRFETEDGRRVTIYASAEIHEVFGQPADYDSDDCCWIKRVANILWATPRRYLAKVKAERSGR